MTSHSLQKPAFLERYGPWAVVAGASAGIGAAYADQLAARGLNLVLIARRLDLLDALSLSLAARYSVETLCLPVDLASPGAARQVFESVRGLEVGLLVYNAAFSAIGPFLDRPLQDHLREMDTNIRTPLELVYLFGNMFVDRGRGGLILMSSLSSFQGSAFIAAYSATKAFTTVLAEGLWEEWRDRGVDALVCISGAVRTPGYLASTPRSTGRFSSSTIEPEVVVAEALAALGGHPFVIPGRGNRFSSFIMRHLLPRRMTIRIMGRVLRNMYVSR
jgi:short-subunit dehydrogenase